VYDILGREVAVLVQEEQNSGSYEIQFPGNRNFASGIYFYKLTSAGTSDIKKMILIK
jgi:hypothetical protein